MRWLLGLPLIPFVVCCVFLGVLVVTFVAERQDVI